MKSLWIIANSREMAYVWNLLKMMRYDDDNVTFLNPYNKDIKPELSSIGVYNHNELNIKNNDIILFCNIQESLINNNQLIYQNMGMRIYSNNKKSSYTILCNVDELEDYEYNSFLSLANSKRYQFLKNCNEYVNSIPDNNRKYPLFIRGKFEKIPKASLFGRLKENNKKTLQMYECLNFIFYLDFLIK